MTDGRPLGVGVMGCSSFALRAMLPAMALCDAVRLVAIASRDGDKARATAAGFPGCRPVDGYDGLLSDPEIDAIYMPLPTGIHREWVAAALSAGKHLLVEKSLAMDAGEAAEMVAAARQRGLLLQENFLFPRHSQAAWVRRELEGGTVGQLRFFRAAFTIPPLDPSNFRYQAAAGGGALLDVGAYMVKSTLHFLGDEARLTDAAIEDDRDRGIDLAGAATFVAPSGVVSQTVWGFDTNYQCSWEFIGTAGRILCRRALTPPPGHRPSVRVERGNDGQELELDADNHYLNQWYYFAAAARDPAAVRAETDATARQAELLAAVRSQALKLTRGPAQR
jgi:predicted dehydrogenase